MAAFDVYRALWRHRFLIIGLTVLTGGLAFFLSSRQPKVYEATALVRVQQKITTAGDAFGSLEVGTRLAQTYAKIVRTDTINRRVAASLVGSVPPADISISAAPVDNVELLEITARSESPQTAALVANAASIALKSFVTDTGTLRDQVIVVDRASPPDIAVSPRVKLTVALAVLLGLLLNCALALLAELFADRLPEPAEMESVFDLPVLATIPSLSFPKPQDIPQPALTDELVGAPVGSGGRARERGR